MNSRVCRLSADDRQPFCSNRNEFFTQTSDCRTEFFDGSVHKCPNCGQPLEAFSVKCPSCGYELRDISTSASVASMSKMFQDAENNEDRVAVVRSFPIPNTKEDIIEFLTWAASNVNPQAYALFSNSRSVDKDAALSDAWEAKLDQAYSKAKILFGSDPEFVAIDGVYKTTKKKITHAKGSFTRFFRTFVAIVIIGWIVLISLKVLGLM